VSVIIPTFKSDRTLERCLASVRREAPSGEVIVLDRFSPDRTCDIARKMGARLIQADFGRAEARNLGIDHSGGEYVMLLDADQELTEHTMRECVDAVVSARADAVTVPELFLGEGFWGGSSALWKNTVAVAEGVDGGIPRFFRARVVKEGLRFEDGAIYWEDIDAYRRMKSKGARTARCEGLIVHHEVGDSKEAGRKYFTYGKSATASPSGSARANLLRTLRTTFNVLAILVKKPRKPISIYFGAFVVATLKASAFLMGLVSMKIG